MSDFCADSYSENTTFTSAVNAPVGYAHISHTRPSYLYVAQNDPVEGYICYSVTQAMREPTLLNGSLLTYVVFEGVRDPHTFVYRFDDAKGISIEAEYLAHYEEIPNAQGLNQEQGQCVLATSTSALHIQRRLSPAEVYKTPNEVMELVLREHFNGRDV